MSEIQKLYDSKGLSRMIEKIVEDLDLDDKDLDLLIDCDNEGLESLCDDTINDDMLFDAAKINIIKELLPEVEISGPLFRIVHDPTKLVYFPVIDE